MKRMLLCLATLALAFTFTLPQRTLYAEALQTETPSAEASMTAALDEYFDHCFSVRKVVGGAIVIARNGEVIYRRAYGFKNASRTKPVTTDTCYRIASITKLVSATGLMRLYEQGLFSLDAPLSDALPFPVANPAYPDDPITARQTLSHTSGFVQIYHYHPNWTAIKANNQYFKKNTRPGTKYMYSNMNGGLTGALIEALSGKSVNAYMRQYVFDPLQINAAYAASLLPDSSDIANLLDKSGANIKSGERLLADAYEDTCAPEDHIGHTVGGLYISAEGLSRFISMLQMGGELSGAHILNAETIALMEQDQDLIEGSSVHAKSPYGLSLARVYGMTGGTWYGHQGRINGLSSNAYYQKETGLSVVVIANGYNAMAKDDVVTIARAVMEKASGLVLDGTWGD